MTITPLGRAMREYRIKHGMLLYDMAKELHISSATLSSYEVGKDIPPQLVIDNVRRLYGIEAEDA